MRLVITRGGVCEHRTIHSIDAAKADVHSAMVVDYWVSMQLFLEDVCHGVTSGRFKSCLGGKCMTQHS